MDKATEVITPEVLVQLLQELQAMESGNPADFGPGAQARTQPQPQIQPQPQPQPQPGSFEGAFPRGGNIPLQPAQQTQSPSPMQSAQPSPEELYGIQQQGDPGIAQLMKLLEGAKMPVPERPKQSNETLRMIAGSLGDAATTMSNLRLGHPAGQGAFAQSRQLTEDRYQKQLAEATRFNSELGAKARLMMFDNKLQMRRESAKPAKPTALKESKFETTDSDGNNITLPLNYNSETGQYSATNIGGLPKQQKPGQIVNGTLTGPDGTPETGFYRIGEDNSITKIDPMEGSFEPVMSPSLAKEISGQKALMAGVPGMSEAWKKADDALGGNKGVMNYYQNLVQNLAAPTKFFKPLAPTELVNYYREMRAILFPYVKSISGAAFPEAELQRYESQFPLPGLASTDEADRAWVILIDMIVRDVQEKYKTSGREPGNINIPDIPGQPEPVDPPELMWLRSKE